MGTELGLDREQDEPFAEPWQARLFATAVLACERLGLPWDAFSRRPEGGDRRTAGAPPTFESFTVALEHLVGDAHRCAFRHTLSGRGV